MKGVARAGKGTAEFVTAQEDRLQSKVHSTEVNAVWSTLTCYCVVPENIHTPPTEGIGDSEEEGGLEEPKI